MLARVFSGQVMGIDAFQVCVEVDVSRGHPAFNIVGLPDAAVKESKDRVRAAIKNTGYDFPSTRITVNLSPADTRKEGPALDLPIAVGILLCEGALQPERLFYYSVAGELGLDGEVRPIPGVLPLALGASKEQMRGMIVPRNNAEEAAVVEDLEIIGVSSLKQVIRFLNAEEEIEPTEVEVQERFAEAAQYQDDFSEVKGQPKVKRAMEIAAAGGHNVLMIGPPGAGKTMLARRLPSILPPMTLDEGIEVTKIHSIAGLLERETALIATRPFRSPHHTTSNIALIGGGTYPRPGEVSLAHNGVLFLDEMPEFNRSVLEVLRQPLEEGRVNISRAAMTITYPARFILVGAMNPCPCGFLTDPRKECKCTHMQIHKYHARISGPLLDRIDIHIEVPPVTVSELLQGKDGEERSAEIQKRVIKARASQLQRFAKAEGMYCNAQMGKKQLKEHAALDEESRGLLERAMTKLALSARAYDRILKVSRTIADLEGTEQLLPHQVAEAIQYRTLDRRLW